MMTLLQGAVGGTYVVLDTNMERSLETRLETLGLTAGARTQILNRKNNGSLILKIRGTRLAVGSKISANICVVAHDAAEGGATGGQMS